MSRHAPSRLARWWWASVLALWIAVCAAATWGAWQNGAADRDLLAHGQAASGTVVAAPPGAEMKLGYCRQVLQVTAPGGTVAVGVTRGCAEPQVTGAVLDVVLDPRDPHRAVAADEVPTPASAYGLPVLVAVLAAGAAGYPLGRWLAARPAR